MRSTELGEIPTFSAMAADVQCVVSPGEGPWVSATTRATVACGKAGLRAGRVLSRRSPSTPSCMKRSCQRQTQVLALAVCRMISAVPTPAWLRRMIRARQTCFCGWLRSATIASRRARSSAVTSKEIPVRISLDSHASPHSGIPNRTLPLGAIH